MNSVDVANMVVEFSWTFLSAFAVLLSVFAIPLARRVRKEMITDVLSLVASGETNGRLAFSQQQVEEGWWLLVAHFLALTHQAVFFGVGIFAILEKETTDHNPSNADLLAIMGPAFALLFAQYLIVVLQICLVMVTISQNRWREKNKEER